MGDNEEQQSSQAAQAAGATLPIEPPLSEGQQVDIHRPKPVHNWRELLGEVGVIVIGVLIALAGEQAVEAIHWQLKAGEARHAVSREIANDVSNYAERIVIEPCLEAQLDRIENGVLAASGVITPLPVEQTPDGFRFIYRHPARTWSNQVWTGVSSEGVASHLPDDLRLGLGEYYGVLERMHRMADDEAATGSALLALSKPVTLDAGSRFQLIQSLESERSRVSALAATARHQLGMIRKFAPEALGPEGRALWYPYLDADSPVGWCRSHHFPLAPKPQL